MYLISSVPLQRSLSSFLLGPRAEWEQYGVNYGWMNYEVYGCLRMNSSWWMSMRGWISNGWNIYETVNHMHASNVANNDEDILMVFGLYLYFGITQLRINRVWGKNTIFFSDIEFNWELFEIERRNWFKSQKLSAAIYNMLLFDPFHNHVFHSLSFLLA